MKTSEYWRNWEGRLELISLMGNAQGHRSFGADSGCHLFPETKWFQAPVVSRHHRVSRHSMPSAHQQFPENICFYILNGIIFRYYGCGAILDGLLHCLI